MTPVCLRPFPLRRTAPLLALAASTLLSSSSAFIPISAGHISHIAPRFERQRYLSSSSDDDLSQLESLHVPELKNKLRVRGLKVGGRKAELIDRLRGYGGDVLSEVETVEDIGNTPLQHVASVPIDGIVIEAGKS